MTAAQASRPSQSAVRSTLVAANLRAISVTVEGMKPQLAEHVAMLKRVDRIISLFLEKRWAFPRRFIAIQPMSYLLAPAPEDATFAEDVDAITQALERHLFGMADSQVFDVKSLVGPLEDMLRLAETPTAEFLTVHAQGPRTVAEGLAPGAASAPNDQPCCSRRKRSTSRPSTARCLIAYSDHLQDADRARQARSLSRRRQALSGTYSPLPRRQHRRRARHAAVNVRDRDL